MNKSLFLCALLYCIPTFADSDATISTLTGNALKTYLSQYALQHIQRQDDESVDVNIMKLSQDITLPPCSEAIDITMSKAGIPEQSSAVTLSCKAEPQWNIYVPIHVSIMTPVLVANRFIRSGEVISSNDLTFAKHDKNALPDGFYKTPASLVGMAARHSIYAGSVLNKTNTTSLPVIKKNQMITLAVRTGAIEVHMQGIAKSDGYLNETIKVLNPSSKKIIDAIVKSSDKAEINY